MNWRLFCILLFSMFFLCVQGANSHDKVIVVPLGGAKGDAGADHVLEGRTFSNSSQQGVTGTRPAAPVAKTGHIVSKVDGDDGWYSLNVGVSVTDRFGGLDFGGGSYDRLTGLSWEPIPPGSTANWESAIARCEAKVTTFLTIFTWDDWRLPTINEMHSIIDRTQINPALPTALNITLPLNSSFWTSTPYWTFGTSAWMVNLASGASEIETMAQPHYNLCVRGQWKAWIVFPLDEDKDE